MSLTFYYISTKLFFKSFFKYIIYFLLKLYRSSDKANVTQQIDRLKAVKANIATVGVGNAINKDELKVCVIKTIIF